MKRIALIFLTAAALLAGCAEKTSPGSISGETSADLSQVQTVPPAASSGEGTAPRQLTTVDSLQRTAGRPKWPGP